MLCTVKLKCSSIISPILFCIANFKIDVQDFTTFLLSVRTIYSGWKACMCRIDSIFDDINKDTWKEH